MVQQVVEMVKRLTSITFNSHGCIYFMEDLCSLAGELVEIQSLGPGPLERYSMGLLTCLSLWEGAKEDMKLDRRPCKSSYSDIFNAIVNMCRGKPK